MMKTVARSIEMLLLSLFFCLVLECGASAKGKAYIAVFYRTFGDAENPEAKKVRAALNKALEDAGIAYQEYDGEDDPLIQLMQIVQEKDAMLLIVNPAEQSLGDAGEKAGEETEKNSVADTGADATADIIVQTDGRPLIFFDCEISEKTVETAEDLCVLVNAAEPQMEPETEMGITSAEMIAAELQSETETKQEAKTEIEGEIRAETETEGETEAGTKAEIGLQEKNIQGMADTIALIAGNYMTGAGYFEGIEEDWVTDEWRIDVEY